MRYAGVGNVTTAGLALALPIGWELWRAYARARIVSLCRTADRWDVGRRVWRQPSPKLSTRTPDERTTVPVAMEHRRARKRQPDQQSAREDVRPFFLAHRSGSSDAVVARTSPTEVSNALWGQASFVTTRGKRLRSADSNRRELQRRSRCAGHSPLALLTYCFRAR